MTLVQSLEDDSDVSLIGENDTVPGIRIDDEEVKSMEQSSSSSSGNSTPRANIPEPLSPQQQQQQQQYDQFEEHQQSVMSSKSSYRQC